MKLITFQCDKCGTKHTESVQGDGAPGWSQYNGIRFEIEGKVIDNPMFCNFCTSLVADWLNNFMGGQPNDVD